ncbi:MAG TPA: glycosyltransferase family 4 protein, partial [Anaerolineae bacterium]
PPASPLSKLLDARGMEWCSLSMPRLNVPSPLMPVRWLSAARRLARLANEQRIDLIHANTVRAHLISAFVRGTPIVWMLHDDTFPRRLFTALRRRAAWLIANSRATARYYGIEGDSKASVVYNGIDTTAAPGNRSAFRRQFGIDPDALVVAHVGRLARWKGQDVFARAAARIAPTFPDARFMLVGTFAEDDEARGELGGGAAYEAELRQLAGSSGLGNSLIFAGHQDNMADVYAGIDLLIHSSTRPEPFGRVIIEAMSASLPVIASAHGGPAEIVEDGVTGLLVPPGESNRLAQVMSGLLNDAPRRQAMGSAARQRACERFDIRQQVEAVQSIYLNVIRENQSRRH